MTASLGTRRVWILIAVAAALAVALFAIAAYYLPIALVNTGGLGVEQRLKAENDFRASLIQFGTVVGLVGALIFTALTVRQTSRSLELSARTYELQRRGQVTERFTKAIDQLGEGAMEKMEIRIGGIYALEQIARDSEELCAPIMEILTTFVRSASRASHDAPASVAAAGADGTEAAGSLDENARSRFRPDLQAALTVLACRPSPSWPKPLDLRRSRISGARLPDAWLEQANLYRAQLMEADMVGAHLAGAFLRGTDLTGAYLDGADLREAVLDGAILRRASLLGADVTGADLTGADLDGASLVDADGTGAVKGLRLPQLHAAKNWRRVPHLSGFLETGSA